MKHRKNILTCSLLLVVLIAAVCLLGALGYLAYYRLLPPPAAPDRRRAGRGPADRHHFRTAARRPGSHECYCRRPGRGNSQRQPGGSDSTVGRRHAGRRTEWSRRAVERFLVLAAAHAGRPHPGRACLL